MVFNRSLSDSKSPQVSTTLLGVLADLNNPVVWMVISKSSSPLINPLVTVPSVPIAIGITTSFCSIFFSVLKQGIGTYLSFHFLSVLPCGQLKRQSPLFNRFSFLFLLFFFFFYWLSLGLVVWPRLSNPFVFQNPRKFSVSQFQGQILGCVYMICSYAQISTSCSGATTPDQCGPGSDGNKVVLRFPQSSSIRAPASDCLVSFQGTTQGSLTLLQR